MNAGLVFLLLIGIAGLIAITWLTIAGFRQQWIEYRTTRNASRNDSTLTLKVKARVNFTDTLFRVELIPEKPKSLPSFEAGQYLTLLIPQEGKKNKIRRSYSLASWHHRPGVYELAIKREASGKGSSWLFDALHEGATIETIKPKGSFKLSSTDKEIILVAGGIGITPLRSMLHYLITLPQAPPVKLFFASRFREGLCYNEEFIAYQEKYSWFKYIPILSQPNTSWQGLTGRLTGILIKRWLGSLASSQFYFCASTEMMDTIMRDLMQHGVDQHQFHFENFAVSSGNVSEGSFTINIEGYGDVIYEKANNIFQVLEEQDYPIQGDCRVGQCGRCKMKLNKGSVKWIARAEAFCTDKEFLPCICQPVENLEISN
jgi:ferredoxin-NADP reductase